MLEPDWLPERSPGSEALLPPLLPPEDDEGMPGIDDPEPLRPEEDGEGMPERPEEPDEPDEPLDPEDPPLDDGEDVGEGIEEDC